MANGDALRKRMEFEEMLKKKDYRSLNIEIGMMVYDHCEAQKDMPATIASNKKRSITNRYLILGVFLILVCLGVVDKTVIDILPFF